MSDRLQDARIAKLPKWTRRLIETQSRRIRHLESAIKDYENEGKTRISYSYGSGSGSRKHDRFLPEHSDIEWGLKTGRIIRIHERMESGNLAISTDGQLTVLPMSGNWIEIQP